MLDTIYEEKIVAFVDILGFSDLVMQSYNNPEVQRKIKGAMDIIHYYEHLKNQFKTEELGVQMTTFSDSIIISYPLTFAGGLFNVFMDLIHLQMDLLEIGIFIRGGISIGAVYHDKENVFGPAVIDAYTLESKKAIFPRIILSVDNIERGFANSPGFHNEYDTGLFLGVVREDKDGWVYLDFLGQFEEFDEFEDYCNWLKKLRGYLLKNLNKHHAKGKIYEKYKWFLDYWNSAFDSEDMLKIFTAFYVRKSAQQLVDDMKISKTYLHV